MNKKANIGYFSSPPLIMYREGNWDGPIVDFLNVNIFDGFSVHEFEYDFERLYGSYSVSNEFFVGIFNTNERMEIFRFSSPLLWFPVFLVDRSGVVVEPSCLCSRSTCYVEDFDLGGSIITDLPNNRKPKIVLYDYAAGGFPKLKSGSEEFFIGDILTLGNRFRNLGLDLSFDSSKAFTRVGFSLVAGGRVDDLDLAAINERIETHRPMLIKTVQKAADSYPELSLVH